MKIKKILCFVLSIVLVLLALTGCVANKEVSFQEGVHTRNDGYDRQFNTYYTSNDDFEFHIKSSVYDEETAKSLYNTVQADFNILKSYFSIDTQIKIYVEQSTLTKDVFVNENNFYCTIDDIENKAYLYGLVSAYLGITEPWKIYGICNYIYESEIDTSILTDYYNDEENMLTLSLFAGFFNIAFSDENTIDIAIKTAKSFVTYLIEQYGMDTFLSCDFSENYRQEWLNSISINKNYNIPYDLSWLNGAKYTKTDLYPLVINLQNRIYYLSPITSNRVSFDTPQSVIKALCDYQVGMANILSYIQANAPTQYANVLSNWESKITYYFYESSGKSHASTSTNEIFITQLRALFHESIHILVHPLVGQSEAWKGEGIAEYLSFLDGTINDLENIAYLYLTVDTEELVGDDLIFINMIREYYFSKAPYPQGPDDTNHALFYESIKKHNDLTPPWRL